MKNIQHRIILFHQQSTSARTRFLFYKQRNSVLGFSPLSELAVLMEDCDDNSLETIKHQRLSELDVLMRYNIGIPADKILLDSEFIHLIDVPKEIIAVSLGRFTDIDPPFEWAESMNMDFRELTGVRNVNPVELELMQKAYQRVMG